MRFLSFARRVLASRCMHSLTAMHSPATCVASDLIESFRQFINLLSQARIVYTTINPVNDEAGTSQNAHTEPASRHRKVVRLVS